MNVDVANRLARRRRAAGLSQEALAEKLGVTRQAVSKWERSESSPDTDNLIALANLYGVSLDDLLYAEIQDAAVEDDDGIDVDAHNESTENATDSADTEAGKPDAQSENESESNSENSEDKKDNFHIGPDGIFVQDGRDHVSISHEGIHVIDSKKGDTVHVGWDGIHVNDQHYDNLKDFHKEFPQYTNCKGDKKSPVAKAWMRFPFPVLAILAYILIGLATNMWLQGLFIVFTIPIYYIIGTFIGTRSISSLVSGLYSTGAIAWFCYMAFVLNQPHPAWVVLLTIPLVCALAAWAGHVIGKRKPS
ncbi:helix-turn-helix domain-containing protein [Adlercreutzia sp. ZJ154]|uniref:helix-turn-helix domain-containing protein n=1 Tax=Adlercreutzia sp. ZJ154 TaxID=2709790 RepID=UPI0013EA5641|nr:helix-turn-helix domain-containing protein [Adlercreutzia sp. ZJ154]